MRIAALFLILPAIAPCQQVAIGEFPLASRDSGPEEITLGPDGNLWFTQYTGRLGRITPAGVVTEYPLPDRYSYPGFITTGPDGALWFTEQGVGRIGRITTSGKITEYDLSDSNSNPAGIAVGSDGALWFTESAATKIGRITTAGVITEYALPSSFYPPYAIAAGSDGALWFTASSDLIGRITTDGVVTNYVLAQESDPLGIVAGPDGALWFVEGLFRQIGRITTDGQITTYGIPPVGLNYPNPEDITVGPDGALWFTEFENEATALGRITTDGVVTQYSLTPTNGQAAGITQGPNGTVWFTEFAANAVGQVVFPTASLSADPTSGTYRTSLTFSGSGFAADENVSIYISGVGSAVLASATADASGSFTATARAPVSVYGPRLFLGVGQTSQKLSAANFQMQPLLKLTPPSGSVGSTVTAEGYGYGSLEKVDVYWNNPRTLMGTATANVHGTFNGSAAVTFTVPAGAAAGKNGVFGHGETTKATGSATFTVN